MLVAEVPDDIDISRKNSSMVDIPRALSSMVPGRQCNIPTTDLSSSDCTSWPYSKMRKDDNIDVKSIRLDISFKSASHTGLQTSELVICMFCCYVLAKWIWIFSISLRK